MRYYQIEPDIYVELGEVSKNPVMPDPDRPYDHIGFLGGRYIKAAVPNPLQFEVSCTKEVPHLLGAESPVVSTRFAGCLSRLGVDNFQVFPAVLVNPETGEEWHDYLAFNAVGLVDAVDPRPVRSGMITWRSTPSGWWML